jgi:hypothetical protein
MNSKEFWDEHVITHKLIIYEGSVRKTIGVGPINMCRRYVQEHPKLNVIIKEL